MKLYYTPATCSLTAHIILEELGQPFEAVAVDLKAHTVNGQDYYQVNPQGSVPALVLDDGSLLTQGSAIILYLAERDPKQQLIPPAGTMARYRWQEWVGLLNADLHKAFAPLFKSTHFVNSDGAIQELKQQARANVSKLMTLIEQKLPDNGYVLGQYCSAVDIYLFMFSLWLKMVDIPSNPWVRYNALVQRVVERPTVQKVLKAEGLS